MKAALHGFVYDLAPDLGPHGGAANAVAPGFVPDTAPPWPGMDGSGTAVFGQAGDQTATSGSAWTRWALGVARRQPCGWCAAIV